MNFTRKNPLGSMGLGMEYLKNIVEEYFIGQGVEEGFWVVNEDMTWDLDAAYHMPIEFFDEIPQIMKDTAGHVCRSKKEAKEINSTRLGDKEFEETGDVSYFTPFDYLNKKHETRSKKH